MFSFWNAVHLFTVGFSALDGHHPVWNLNYSHYIQHSLLFSFLEVMYIPARPTAVSEFHHYAIVYKILHAQSQDRKLGSPPLFAISAPSQSLLFLVRVSGSERCCYYSIAWLCMTAEFKSRPYGAHGQKQKVHKVPWSICHAMTSDT